MNGPPPEYSFEEARIVHCLQSCGLDRAGFTVTYDDSMQSFKIVMSERSGVVGNDVKCIQEAVGYELARFEDAELQRVYGKYVQDLLVPQMRAENERYLKERGLLESAPTLAKVGNLKELANEMEILCEFEPGSMLIVEGEEPTLGGDGSALLHADYEQTACLLALIKYSGVTKFGFIGNERYRAEDD